MAGIAVRLLAHEQERAGDEARSVATAQLSSVVEKIDLAVKVAQDELMHSLQRFPAATLAENLQSWEEKNPLVRNVFIYDQSGMLLLQILIFHLPKSNKDFCDDIEASLMESTIGRSTPTKKRPIRNRRFR